MKRPSLIKSLAVVLSVTLFTTQCAFAHAQETALWTERQQAKHLANAAPSRFELASLPSLSSPASALSSSLSPSSVRPAPLLLQRLGRNLSPALRGRLLPVVEALSTNAGSVRAIARPAGDAAGPIVIHIQDVHMNTEAQTNISRALSSLMDHKAIDLVALEGTTGPIDLAELHDYPHRETMADVASLLLRENVISGPIHAAITQSGAAAPVVGVDDAVHYRRNVDAYRAAAPLAPSFQKETADREHELAEAKQTIFSPALKQFDDKIQGYRNGAVTVGAYAELLASTLQSADVSDSLRSFLETCRLESSMNLNQVETERRRLIERLSPALSRAEMAELFDQGVAFRLGTIRSGDFYRALQTLCERHVLGLDRFPAFKTYVHYVLSADAIDADRLYADLKNAERAGYTALAKTPGEKRLVAETQRIYLEKKLAAFGMTRDEWDEYDMSRKMKGEISKFESFYTEAQIRDGAMAANLLAEMKKRRASVAVLVTGGFHSSGIEEKLKNAGVTTVSFVPTLTKVDDNADGRYLTVFTQEKTPLDKLLEGPKLFLAKAAVTEAGIEEAEFSTAIEDLGTGAASLGFVADHLKFLRRFVLASFKKIATHVQLRFTERANRNAEMVAEGDLADGTHLASRLSVRQRWLAYGAIAYLFTALVERLAYWHWEFLGPMAVITLVILILLLRDYIQRRGVPALEFGMPSLMMTSVPHNVISGLAMNVVNASGFTGTAPNPREQLGRYTLSLQEEEIGKQRAVLLTRIRGFSSDQEKLPVAHEEGLRRTVGTFLHEAQFSVPDDQIQATIYYRPAQNAASEGQLEIELTLPNRREAAQFEKTRKVATAYGMDLVLTPESVSLLLPLKSREALIERIQRADPAMPIRDLLSCLSSNDERLVEVAVIRLRGLMEETPSEEGLAPLRKILKDILADAKANKKVKFSARWLQRRLPGTPGRFDLTHLTGPTYGGNYVLKTNDTPSGGITIEIWEPGDFPSVKGFWAVLFARIKFFKKWLIGPEIFAKVHFENNPASSSVEEWEQNVSFSLKEKNPKADPDDLGEAVKAAVHAWAQGIQPPDAEDAVVLKVGFHYGEGEEDDVEPKNSIEGAAFADTQFKREDLDIGKHHVTLAVVPGPGTYPFDILGTYHSPVLQGRQVPMLRLVFAFIAFTIAILILAPIHLPIFWDEMHHYRKLKELEARGRDVRVLTTRRQIFAIFFGEKKARIHARVKYLIDDIEGLEAGPGGFIKKRNVSLVIGGLMLVGLSSLNLPEVASAIAPFYQAAISLLFIFLAIAIYVLVVSMVMLHKNETNSTSDKHEASRKRAKLLASGNSNLHAEPGVMEYRSPLDLLREFRLLLGTVGLLEVVVRNMVLGVDNAQPLSEVIDLVTEEPSRMDEPRDDKDDEEERAAAPQILTHYNSPAQNPSLELLFRYPQDEPQSPKENPEKPDLEPRDQQQEKDTLTGPGAGGSGGAGGRGAMATKRLNAQVSVESPLSSSNGKVSSSASNANARRTRTENSSFASPLSPNGSATEPQSVTTPMSPTATSSPRSNPAYPADAGSTTLSPMGTSKAKTGNAEGHVPGAPAIIPGASNLIQRTNPGNDAATNGAKTTNVNVDANVGNRGWSNRKAPASVDAAHARMNPDRSGIPSSKSGTPAQSPEKDRSDLRNATELTLSPKINTGGQTNATSLTGTSSAQANKEGTSEKRLDGTSETAAANRDDQNMSGGDANPASASRTDGAERLETRQRQGDTGVTAATNDSNLRSTNGQPVTQQELVNESGNTNRFPHATPKGPDSASAANVSSIVSGRASVASSENGAAESQPTDVQGAAVLFGSSRALNIALGFLLNFFLVAAILPSITALSNEFTVINVSAAYAVASAVVTALRMADAVRVSAWAHEPVRIAYVAPVIGLLFAVLAELIGRTRTAAAIAPQDRPKDSFVPAKTLSESGPAPVMASGAGAPDQRNTPLPTANEDSNHTDTEGPLSINQFVGVLSANATQNILVALALATLEVASTETGTTSPLSVLNKLSTGQMSEMEIHAIRGLILRALSVRPLSFGETNHDADLPTAIEAAVHAVGISDFKKEALILLGAISGRRDSGVESDGQSHESPHDVNVEVLVARIKAVEARQEADARRNARTEKNALAPVSSGNPGKLNLVDKPRAAGSHLEATPETIVRPPNNALAANKNADKKNDDEGEAAQDESLAPGVLDTRERFSGNSNQTNNDQRPPASADHELTAAAFSAPIAARSLSTVVSALSENILSTFAGLRAAFSSPSAHPPLALVALIGSISVAGGFAGATLGLGASVSVGQILALSLSITLLAGITPLIFVSIAANVGPLTLLRALFETAASPLSLRDIRQFKKLDDLATLLVSLTSAILKERNATGQQLLDVLPKTKVLGANEQTTLNALVTLPEADLLRVAALLKAKLQSNVSLGRITPLEAGQLFAWVLSQAGIAREFNGSLLGKTEMLPVHRWTRQEIEDGNAALELNEIESLLHSSRAAVCVLINADSADNITAFRDALERRLRTPQLIGRVSYQPIDGDAIVLQTLNPDVVEAGIRQAMQSSAKDLQDYLLVLPDGVQLPGRETLNAAAFKYWALSRIEVGLFSGGRLVTMPASRVQYLEMMQKAMVQA